MSTASTAINEEVVDDAGSSGGNLNSVKGLFNWRYATHKMQGTPVLVLYISLLLVIRSSNAKNDDDGNYWPSRSQNSASEGFHLRWGAKTFPHSAITVGNVANGIKELFRSISSSSCTFFKRENCFKVSREGLFLPIKTLRYRGDKKEKKAIFVLSFNKNTGEIYFPQNANQNAITLGENLAIEFISARGTVKEVSVSEGANQPTFKQLKNEKIAPQVSDMTISTLKDAHAPLKSIVLSKLRRPQSNRKKPIFVYEAIRLDSVVESIVLNPETCELWRNFEGNSLDCLLHSVKNTKNVCGPVIFYDNGKSLFVNRRSIDYVALLAVKESTTTESQLLRCDYQKKIVDNVETRNGVSVGVVNVLEEIIGAYTDKDKGLEDDLILDVNNRGGFLLFGEIYFLEQQNPMIVRFENFKSTLDVYYDDIEVEGEDKRIYKRLMIQCDKKNAFESLAESTTNPTVHKCGSFTIMSISFLAGAYKSKLLHLDVDFLPPQRSTRHDKQAVPVSDEKFYSDSGFVDDEFDHVYETIPDDDYENEEDPQNDLQKNNVNSMPTANENNHATYANQHNSRAVFPHYSVEDSKQRAMTAYQNVADYENLPRQNYMDKKQSLGDLTANHNQQNSVDSAPAYSQSKTGADRIATPKQLLLKKSIYSHQSPQKQEHEPDENLSENDFYEVPNKHFSEGESNSKRHTVSQQSSGNGPFFQHSQENYNDSPDDTFYNNSADELNDIQLPVRVVRKHNFKQWFKGKPNSSLPAGKLLRRSAGVEGNAEDHLLNTLKAQAAARQWHTTSGENPVARVRVMRTRIFYKQTLIAVSSGRNTPLRFLHSDGELRTRLLDKSK